MLIAGGSAEGSVGKRCVMMCASDAAGTPKKASAEARLDMHGLE